MNAETGTERAVERCDIAIVGAGPAGLCFALSLADSGLDIVLVEQQLENKLADPEFDGRDLALTHGSQQLLQQLGVWRQIADDEISPLRDARVLNGSSPYAMHIDHRDGGLDTLGALVSNHVIRRAAYQALRERGTARLRCETRVTGIRADAFGASLQFAGGGRLDAKLIVAADSRFSETRHAMGIAAGMHDFGRNMMVCRMAHERSHEDIACEWFDYGQTIALLPLRDSRCSVVLTLPAQQLEVLRAMSPEVFAHEVEGRLKQRLGRMRLISERHVYPLVGVYPRRFVSTRYALVGDAAVGMHPVTAHGFNFGLLGQSLLSKEILSSVAAGRDIGAPSGLAHYDRALRRATLPLYLATQALVKLYTDDRPPARLLRGAMLRIGGRFTPFRKAVASMLTQEGAA